MIKNTVTGVSLVLIFCLVIFQFTLTFFPEFFIHKKTINKITDDLKQKGINIEEVSKPAYTSGILTKTKYQLNFTADANMEFSKYNGLLSMIFKNKLVKFMNNDISKLSKDKINIKVNNISLIAVPFKNQYFIKGIDNISASFIKNKNYNFNIKNIQLNNFSLQDRKKSQSYNLKIFDPEFNLRNYKITAASVELNNFKSKDLYLFLTKKTKKPLENIINDLKLKYETDVSINNLSIKSKKSDYNIKNIWYIFNLDVDHNLYFCSINLNINDAIINNNKKISSEPGFLLKSELRLSDISPETINKFIDKKGNKLLKIQELLNTIKSQNPKVEINMKLIDNMTDINAIGNLVFKKLIPTGKIEVDVNNFAKLKNKLSKKNLIKYKDIIKKLEKDNHLTIQIKNKKPFVYVDNIPLIKIL